MNRIIAILIMATFCSCGETQQQAGKTKETVTKTDQVTLKSSLDQLEEALRNNTTAKVDKEKATELISKSIEYVDAFPKDEISPEYLFRAGEVCVGIGSYDQALEIWDRVRTEYSEHKKASIALFLQGFTCENQLKNIDKAKGYYNDFLAKYPKHEYADQVISLLKNIDMSPEDLIKSFKQKK